MASIHYEMMVDVSVERAWKSLGDVGSPHRLFAGVLTDARMEGDIRTVTFANAMVVREQIVDVSESDRRVAYTVIDGSFKHHSASMQLFAAGERRCRFVWITDLLPNERAAMVKSLVEQGCAAMKRVLEDWTHLDRT
jgi:Polyketide cyclase / dehydrase and lipid transport